MRGNVPDRTGSGGVSRRQALAMVGVVVGGGGVWAGLQRSDAFTTAGTDRDSQVEIKQDSDAIVPITGKTADITPEFGNQFGTDLTLTLSAPNDSSAVFDVGLTGTTESVATFTVATGTTTTVGMNADISPISVAIDGVHGNGEVSIMRNFAIPQVTVDNVSSLDGGEGGSFTLTHTVGSGGNRVIYYFVTLKNSDSNKEVGSAEFNGNSMTEAENVIGGDQRIQVFRLTNPASGSGSGSIDIKGSEKNKVGLGVVSLENVDQTDPEDAFLTGSGESASPSITGISTTQVDLVIDVISTNKAKGMEPGPEQTDQWRAFKENGDSKESGGSTNDGSGSVDMSWSLNEKGKFVQVAVNINNG